MKEGPKTAIAETWTLQSLSVLNGLTTPIWVYDLDRHKKLWANAAAVDLWGAPDMATLIARGKPSELTEGTRRRLESYRQRFDQGRTVNEEWTFYPSGGAPVRAQITCSGLFFQDGRGRRLAMLVEARPLDRARPELRLLEALRHTEEQISLYTVSGAPLVRNPAAESALGLIPDHADDVDAFESVFASPEDARRARTAALDNVVLCEELLVNTVDGARWHDVEVRRVVDPLTGDSALLCCQRDVHARHEMTVRLKTLRDQAEAASAAKSQFLAVVSHELRTPMTGVLAAAQLLEDSTLDADQAEALDMVLAAGRQMVSLIDDLLDLPRIEAGQLDVERTSTNIGRSLREGLGPFATRARAEGREINIDVPADSLIVRCDSNRILQIAVNLFSNAAKFSSHGAIRISADTNEDAECTWLRIWVSDQGIGMTPKQQQDVFDAFVQADSSLSRRREGLGLGLHISRRWARAMGGELTVESKLGVGSTFELRVPVEPVTEALEPTPRMSRIGNQQLSLRVLVVDDNALNRRAFARAIKRWGCEVETASGGREAIASIGRDRPDVVLMDVQMPDLDGASAARLLRDQPELNKLPIIAVTADAYFQGSQAYEQAAFDGFVLKPIAWDDLFATLSEVTAT